MNWVNSLTSVARERVMLRPCSGAECKYKNTPEKRVSLNIKNETIK